MDTTRTDGLMPYTLAGLTVDVHPTTCAAHRVGYLLTKLLDAAPKPEDNYLATAVQAAYSLLYDREAYDPRCVDCVSDRQMDVDQLFD